MTLQITIADLNRAKTKCPTGHPYDQINTYIDTRGCRRCRACRTEYIRNWRNRKLKQKRCVDCGKACASKSKRFCQKHFRYHAKRDRARKQKARD